MSDQTRSKDSTPLLGAQPFKLVLFGTNLRRGTSITTHPGAFDLSWESTLRLARRADDLDFEAIVPVARWRGFEGAARLHRDIFEPFVWGAALLMSTSRIMVCPTAHVPTIHPLVAAKQGATLDQLSAGRSGLNLTYGWNRADFDLFGIEPLGHAERYEYMTEWFELVRRLWVEPAAFDFHGRHFEVRGGWSQPKPLQQPYPVTILAGGSPSSMRFAARYADVALLVMKDLEDGAAQVRDARELANELGRALQLIVGCTVYCRPTEREARDLYRSCVFEHGDWDTADRFVRAMVGTSRSVQWDAVSEREKERAIAGFGKTQLIGSPDQIVDELVRIRRAGFDGITLCWVDYDDGLDFWGSEVMPRLVQAGLRVNRAG